MNRSIKLTLAGLVLAGLILPQATPPPIPGGCSNCITTQANGYVGIGTSTPQAVLDVNGQIDLLGVQGIAFPTVDSTANGTVLIGSGAGVGLPASAAYGNVAVGYQSLGAVGLTTAAINLTAIGFQALNANTSGASSTAVGYQALAQTTTTTNTAVGFKALGTGNSNSSTAVGFNANASGAITNGATLGSNSCSVCTGTGDTALGANANRFVSSGARNVAVGQSAIQGITGTRVTGSDNTAVGDTALLLCQGACASNTVLGSAVGSTITTGTNNILIGNSATCAPGAITNSNEFHLCGPTADIMSVTGDGTVGTEIVTIHGVTTLTTTAATTAFTATNSVGSCTHTPGVATETVACASDSRFKHDITDAHWYSWWLHSFQIHRYIGNASGKEAVSPVAQEVQKIHPDMVHEMKDEKGNVLRGSDGMPYLAVDAPNPWILVRVVQELQDAVVLLFIGLIGSFVFTWVRTR